MSKIKKKLVVVGDSCSGKSYLLDVFRTNEYPKVYVPSVFEHYVADIRVDDKVVELALYDATGLENYDRLRALSYPNTDVILMCFAIGSPKSLENIPEKWVPEVKHFCPKDVPIVLVGNKLDLRTDQYWIEEPRRRNQTVTTGG